MNVDEVVRLTQVASLPSKSHGVLRWSSSRLRSSETMNGTATANETSWNRPSSSRGITVWRLPAKIRSLMTGMPPSRDAPGRPTSSRATALRRMSSR